MIAHTKAALLSMRTSVIEGKSWTSPSFYYFECQRDMWRRQRAASWGSWKPGNTSSDSQLNHAFSFYNCTCIDYFYALLSALFCNTNTVLPSLLFVGALIKILTYTRNANDLRCAIVFSKRMAGIQVDSDLQSHDLRCWRLGKIKPQPFLHKR